MLETGIKGIEILGTQLILSDAQSLRKALIVYNFTSAKEFNGITYIGVINKTQNVIVGCSRLLLCCILVSNLFRLHFPFNLDVKPF